MKIHHFAAPLLLVLASCAAPPPKFKDMTSAELLAYNRSVDPIDQVYCRKEVSTGSHIRRQNCIVLRDLIYGTTRSLDTPSSSRTILSPF